MIKGRICALQVNTTFSFKVIRKNCRHEMYAIDFTVKQKAKLQCF